MGNPYHRFVCLGKPGILIAYSGDTRSLILMISVHWLVSSVSFRSGMTCSGTCISGIHFPKHVRHGNGKMNYDELHGVVLLVKRIVPISLVSTFLVDTSDTECRITLFLSFRNLYDGFTI